MIVTGVELRRNWKKARHLPRCESRIHQGKSRCVFLAGHPHYHQGSNWQTWSSIVEQTDWVVKRWSEESRMIRRHFTNGLPHRRWRSGLVQFRGVGGTWIECVTPEHHR